MELVLGIDNIIFISILVEKVPITKKRYTMNIGILLALICRFVLLFFIGWIISLNKPLFNILTFQISGKDLILFFGGFFLLVKTLIELNHKLFKESTALNQKQSIARTKNKVIIQIIFIDIIFSFDSILTAVGLVKQIELMIIAIIASMIVMLLLSKKITEFINQNPSIKLLALSFLLLIGAYLILESLNLPFDKTLLYFAMGFAFFNELLNMQLRKINVKENIEN